jgi:hypothetical protein
MGTHQSGDHDRLTGVERAVLLWLVLASVGGAVTTVIVIGGHL